MSGKPASVKIRSIAYPLLAAFLWGFAFVFQRMSAGTIGAFTFNASRSLLASVSLGAFLAIRRKALPLPKTEADWRKLLKGGIACGVLLFISTNLQQLGLEGTEAGKTAFITALYVVLVPVFGMFVGHKVSGNVWISVVLATAGLFFLCVSGGFSIRTSDVLVFFSAIMYSIYILAVDRFGQGVNPVALSCIQFLVSGLLSLGVAVFAETISLTVIRENMISILYLGIFSSAVAYTLQMAAQQICNPVTCTILLSQESTFGAIASAIILQERLSGRELLGCGMMLCAVLLAQLPGDFWKRKKTA